MKPKPIAQNSDIHSSNLEVELTDLPEEDGSSTIPPAEEGASGDNASAVVDEGCMEEDEEKEDSSSSGETVCLRLEAVVCSDQHLPILNRGKAEVDTLSTQQKADVNLAEMGRKAEKREDEYLWEDGVLVHSKLGDHGREWI